VPLRAAGAASMMTLLTPRERSSSGRSSVVPSVLPSSQIAMRWTPVGL